jgi:hypothetical protein
MFAAGAVQELERKERKRKRDDADAAARDEEDAVAYCQYCCHSSCCLQSFHSGTSPIYWL